MNRKDKFKQFPKASFASRALSYLIDGFLIIFSTILLLNIASNPILLNSDVYKTNRDSLISEVDKLYNIQAETKLVIRDTTSETPALLSDTEIINTYLKKQVALSYSYHQTAYENANITLDSSYVPASYENDNLAYYFTTFKVEKNITVEDFGELSPKQYFIEKLIKEKGGKDLYVFNNDDLPYLKADIGINIYKFINKIDTTDPSHYNSLSSMYAQIASIGLLQLDNYAPYNESFKLYTNAYNTLSNSQFLTAFLTFIVSVVLVVVISQLILGNGITLGRFLSKTRVVYDKGYVSGLIIRLISETILFIPTLFVVFLFTYGFVALNGSIGWFQPIYILIATVLASFINIGSLMMSYQKRSLPDIFSRSSVVKVDKLIPETENDVIDVAEDTIPSENEEIES